MILSVITAGVLYLLHLAPSFLYFSEYLPAPVYGTERVANYLVSIFEILYASITRSSRRTDLSCMTFAAPNLAAVSVFSYVPA